MQNCITGYTMPMRYLAAFLFVGVLNLSSCRNVDSHSSMQSQDEGPLRVSIIRVDPIEYAGELSGFVVAYRIHNGSSEELILDRRGLIGYDFLDEDGDVIPKVPRSIPEIWSPEKHKVLLSGDAHLDREVIVSLGEVIEPLRGRIARLRLFYFRSYMSSDELESVDNLYEEVVFSRTYCLDKYRE